MYVIEIKGINRNVTPMVVGRAGQSDKIDHQNIAPGGDSTRQLGETGLQLSPYSGAIADIESR
jgi:hypothetical protein